MARIKSEELEQEDLEQRCFLDEVMIESSDFLKLYMLQINKLPRPDQSNLSFYSEDLSVMVTRQKLSDSSFHNLRPIQEELNFDFNYEDVMELTEDVSPNTNYEPKRNRIRSLHIDQRDITTNRTNKLKDDKEAMLSKMIGGLTPITAPNTLAGQENKRFLLVPEQENEMQSGSDFRSVTGSDKYVSLMNRIGETEELNQNPSLFNLNEDKDLEFDQDEFDQMAKIKHITEDINLIHGMGDSDN